MKKILSALLFLLISKMAFAKDYGIIGTTYQITEKSLLEEIQEKLQQAKKDGRLNKFQEQVKNNIYQQINDPQAIHKLKNGTKNRQWLYDPSVSLPYDLKDQSGKIFYQANSKVNPLEKINLTKSLIFINGSDSKQVKWALDLYHQRKGRVKIILTEGKIIDLMKTKKIRFYFDQNQILIKKFQIQALPALVEQQEKMLKIMEVVL